MLAPGWVVSPALSTWSLTCTLWTLCIPRNLPNCFSQLKTAKRQQTWGEVSGKTDKEPPKREDSRRAGGTQLVEILRTAHRPCC